MRLRHVVALLVSVVGLGLGSDPFGLLCFVGLFVAVFGRFFVN
jgi:hypothetical protein